MELKKSALFLLILASLLSASIATGRYRNLINQVPEGQTMTEDTKDAELDEDAVRARILMAKTNDYGWYDPAPAFSRPHFKRIPNYVISVLLKDKEVDLEGIEVEELNDEDAWEDYLQQISMGAGPSSTDMPFVPHFTDSNLGIQAAASVAIGTAETHSSSKAAETQLAEPIVHTEVETGTIPVTGDIPVPTSTEAPVATDTIENITAGVTNPGTDGIGPGTDATPAINPGVVLVVSSSCHA
ncbi:hypothetical protein FCM35_KLT20920 [Carex littledalei]|uniref:Uncharacterized protein n=1 Tax=Carex littledalei TaxID=544730 RepID=A0A833VCT7_9POAL|nr:hypothetical protein FCM35_KLT20920 [Carex littledalei]